ncbi:MAG: PadR family transcriptional regulator [Candidatus Thorarchaeota archaeon]
MSKDNSHRPLEPLPIVRALFLTFIQAHPQSTGYSLMKVISDFTDGEVELKSGTAYTELRRLEKHGFVKSIQEEAGRKRRGYEITQAGEMELLQIARQLRFRVNRVLNPLLALIESLDGKSP